MRPSGPLPPQVYWLRRLMLLGVVVVVTAVLWWLISGSVGADGSPASDAAPKTPRSTGSAPDSTATSPPPATTEPPATTQTTPPKNTPRSPNATTSSKPDKQDEPNKTPLAEPNGDCSPDGVNMTIDVADVKSGRSNTATFLLTSTDTPACTLAVTAGKLVVKVTSGDDTVWSSDDCPDALLAKQLVVRADPPSSYQFKWNGARSSEGCQLDDTPLEPGGYWVEAALIGGEPHKAFFDIT